jgi:hypothetical protein
MPNGLHFSFFRLFEKRLRLVSVFGYFLKSKSNIQPPASPQVLLSPQGLKRESSRLSGHLDGNCGANSRKLTWRLPRICPSTSIN